VLVLAHDVLPRRGLGADDMVFDGELSQFRRGIEHQFALDAGLVKIDCLFRYLLESGDFLVRPSFGH
jgi:hypothetical protein